MKNEDISLKTRTSIALALKDAMKHKPISKITVSEIVRACNINRNTFYYHFENIFDLLKWMLEEEAVEQVLKMNLIKDAEEALDFVITYITDNFQLLRNAFSAIGYVELKRYFIDDFHRVIGLIIEQAEVAIGIKMEPEFAAFVTSFYSEAFMGLLANSLITGVIPETDRFKKDIFFICRNSIPFIIKGKEVEKA